MVDNFCWRDWRLIFKLDPDKRITEERLARILHKKPDAIIVGGTQGITRENTARLVELVLQAGYKGPLIQEISESHAVITQVDGYIIPVVLNARDRKWFIGAHLEAVSAYGGLIDWQKVLPVGYIVCNPISAVAAKTQALPVSAADAAAYAAMA
ncbi:heptaprenylglyceryl phosphate synthase, partial [bacterium]